jgi:membrane protein implicated in regulation of membrane protease activity
MGEKLGIGETSARMRAERALDKLRAVLAKKGITSTAAALGFFISTKAVAAPPVGLAATLAIGALAPPVALGASAGAFAKLSKFFAMNKVSPGIVAVAGVGAAGFASYQTDEKAGATAFLVYSICFGVGLLFTILSAVGAHVFGGHGEVGHDFHSGHHSGGHAQGHAEGGGGASDMPGFAPLSPTTIATFITSFGGFGMIFAQLEATRRPWISAPLAAVSGFVIAALVFWLFRTIFRNTQASSEGRVGELVGCSATVITPISPDGVGEIAYVQSGSRYSAPARADDGITHGNGASVKITRIVGTQFYVSSA